MNKETSKGITIIISVIILFFFMICFILYTMSKLEEYRDRHPVEKSDSEKLAELQLNMTLREHELIGFNTAIYYITVEASKCPKNGLAISENIHLVALECYNGGN